MAVSIKQKSMGIALLIHGVILLLFLYFVLTTPVPPMGGGEGVLVNIGYMDMASGDIQPMSENTTVDPVVKQERVQPVEDETKVATQDVEDAPEINNPKTPPKKEPKPVPVKTTTPVVVKKPEPVKVREKTPDPRALYKGKNTNSSSQGNASGGKGDQGDPQGDPFSHEFGKAGNGGGGGDGFGTGTGSGNGNGPGISFNLSGRSMLRLPKVNDTSQDQGKVVIEVTVDKNGNVVSATGPARGSTTTSSNLVKKAKDAAMLTKFNPSAAGVEEQRGTITFNFILR